VRATPSQTERVIGLGGVSPLHNTVCSARFLSSRHVICYYSNSNRSVRTHHLNCSSRARLSCLPKRNPESPPPSTPPPTLLPRPTPPVPPPLPYPPPPPTYSLSPCYPMAGQMSKKSPSSKLSPCTGGNPPACTNTSGCSPSRSSCGTMACSMYIPLRQVSGQN